MESGTDLGSNPDEKNISKFKKPASAISLHKIEYEETDFAAHPKIAWI